MVNAATNTGILIIMNHDKWLKCVKGVVRLNILVRGAMVMEAKKSERDFSVTNTECASRAASIAK